MEGLKLKKRKKEKIMRIMVGAILLAFIVSLLPMLFIR
jgi:hypothetical protein